MYVCISFECLCIYIIKRMMTRGETKNKTKNIRVNCRIRFDRPA